MGGPRPAEPTVPVQRPQTRPPGAEARPASEPRIADLESRLAAALRRAEEAERALSERPPPDNEGGFGMRAERLLRLAEAEARDMRASAARDVSALRERAQAEAEAHRHEVEQELIARSSAFDRAASERTAALDAREEQVKADREALAAEAERVRQAADAEADRIRQAAAADAERMRRVAEEDGRQTRADAQAENGRLAAAQERARHDLSELARVLSSALGGAEAGSAADAGR
jgi:hypothetical protein